MSGLSGRRRNVQVNVSSRCSRRGPATFNTGNKLVQGITDTLALGLVREGVGYGRPVIVVPWFNGGLACNGAYRRSVDLP